MHDTSTGRLIAIDGTDGVGKTTQLKLAAEALRQQGYDVLSTRLFGGTPLGEELRRVMFMNLERPEGVNLYITLAIYLTLAEELEKQRKAGKLILLDRSPLSLIAYETYAEGMDKAEGFRICSEMLDLFHPDALFVYEAPASIIAERRTQRHHDENSNYFENQSADYFERVDEGYKAAIEHFYATSIDASGDTETVHKRTMQAIEAVLANK